MSYEVPSDARDQRILRKQNEELRNLIRVVPQATNANTEDLGGWEGGSIRNNSGNIMGRFILNTPEEQQAVKISWTSGRSVTGKILLKVGDYIATNAGISGTNWLGRITYISTEESDVSGTCICEPQFTVITGTTPRSAFNSGSTTSLKKIKFTASSSGGGTWSEYSNSDDDRWTATYNATGFSNKEVAVQTASMIINRRESTGDLELSNIWGATADGQIMTIKPKDGKTLTLKTGGNIEIASEISLADTDITIMQYHEDGGSKWRVVGGSGSGGAPATVIKKPCRVATTGNNTSPVLIGTQVDGVTIVVGDRVLYKNQTTVRDNGIYVCKSITGILATMGRAEDFDEDSEVKSGVQVAIEEGTVHADEVWQLTTNNPIVVGTTALTWAKISGMEWSTPVDASLIPDTDVTYNLGSNTKHFTNTFTNIIQLGNDTALSDTDTIGSVNFSGKDDGSNGYVNDWASIKSIVDDATSTNKTAHIELRQYDSNAIKTMLKTDQYGIWLSNDASGSSSPAYNGAIYRDGNDVKIRTGGSTLNLSGVLANPITLLDTGLAGTLSIKDGSYSGGTNIAQFGRTSNIHFYNDLDMHNKKITAVGSIGNSLGDTGLTLGASLSSPTDNGSIYRLSSNNRLYFRSGGVTFQFETVARTTLNNIANTDVSADLIPNQTTGGNLGSTSTNKFWYNLYGGRIQFSGKMSEVTSLPSIQVVNNSGDDDMVFNLPDGSNDKYVWDFNGNEMFRMAPDGLRLGDSSSNSSVDGTIYRAGSDVKVRTNSKTVTLTNLASNTLNDLGTTSINSTLLPQNNNSLSVGSTSKYWGSSHAHWYDSGTNATLSDNDTIGGFYFTGKDSGSNLETWAGTYGVVDTVTHSQETSHLEFKAYKNGTYQAFLKTDQFGVTLPYSNSGSEPAYNGAIYLHGNDVKIRTGGSTVNLSNIMANPITTIDTGIAGTTTIEDSGFGGGTNIAQFGRTTGIDFYQTLDMHTHDITELDRLIFSTSSSSDDTLGNSDYGIEVDGGTSDTGLRYNVNSSKSHKFYVGGGSTPVATIDSSGLDASDIGSGTVNVARLGSGATSAKYLRGDNTWQEISSGGGAIQRYQLYNSTSSNSELEMWHCSSHTYGSNGDGMSMQTLTQYRIYWQPLMIPVACKLQYVGLWSDGNNYSNGKYDVGLYSNGGSGSNANLLYPYQRLAQETDVFSHNEALADAETAGDWNYSLDAGLYWLAVLPVGNDVTCANIAPKWMQSMGFYYESTSSGKNDSPVTNGATVGYYKTGQTTLPTTAPDELDRRYSAQTGWEPAIFCRFKS